MTDATPQAALLPINYFDVQQAAETYGLDYNKLGCAVRDILAKLQATTPAMSDQDLLAVAEFVGLIGPGSRIGESHDAAVRFGRALLALPRGHSATPAEPAAGADVLDAVSPVGDWTYSHDEERFHGQFSTREEAIAEGVSCGARFIGRVRHARDLIGDEQIGGGIRERVSEILGDEVGEFAECFTMTADQERELGKLILNWIERGPGFHCWGIKDVEPIDAASGRQE